MKNRKHKQGKYSSQSGVLIFAVVVMIVILGFVGLSATYQYINNKSSGGHTSDYIQSHYLANSAVEYTQYQMSKKGVTCNGLQVNNFSVPGISGLFTTTSKTTQANGTLSANISNTSSSIPLRSTAGFASAGVAYIDNELIGYGAISGNSLTTVTRGGGNTFAASHNTSTVIAQNQCAVTANGGVPTLANTSGKAILTSYLLQQGFAMSYGSVQTTPAVASAGIVALSGTTSVSNPTVTAQSTSFQGSTILSGSFVSLLNSAATYVSNGTQLVASSNGTNFQKDIIYNDSTHITAASLFGMYFSQNKIFIGMQATQMQTTDDLDGVTNKMIWINGCESITSGTIGSASAPVILIINGNLTISGNVTIYGFVYVMGNVTITNGVTINGALASETAIAVDSSAVNLNEGVLTYLYNEFPNDLVGHITVIPSMTTQVTS